MQGTSGPAWEKLGSDRKHSESGNDAAPMFRTGGKCCVTTRYLTLLAIGGVMTTMPTPATAQVNLAPTREEIQPDQLSPGENRRRLGLSVEGGIERAALPAGPASICQYQLSTERCCICQSKGCIAR